MIGTKINELTCLEKLPNRGNNCDYYLWSCSCGNQRIARFYSVKVNAVTRCKECVNKNKGKIPMIGKTYHFLTCLKEIERKEKYGNAEYLFKCSCGNEIIAKGEKVRSGWIKNCQECQYIKKSKNRIDNSVGSISQTWWGLHVKDNAKRKNLELTITMEDAWELFLEQNKKCVFSGIELTFPEKVQANGRPLTYSSTASLDRIDSTRGYIKGNVQWVHKDVNMMKRNKSDEFFVEICCLIANYRKIKVE